MTPRRALPRFIAVGCAAAAAHWAVVVALVGAGMPPLLANPIGWFVAFWLSWAGHQWVTFAHANASARRSLPRFALVSFAGFVVNEAAYAVLLHRTGLGYALALAIVLALVAVLTWIASRRWAFSGTHRRAPEPRPPDATGPDAPSS